MVFCYASFMKSEKIFIYGASGAGKTTHSIEIKKQLGFPLVEADYLREMIAQKEKTIEEDPFVYVGTKEAYRYFGDLNEENVIKGLKAARLSMSPYVMNEISKYTNNLILEGAFLDPEKLSNLGKLMLVVTLDESKHRDQYFHHREKNDKHIESFTAARIIQSYLIKEAGKFNAEVIEN
jgi:2-phosphoglycerate kinase